MQSLQKITSIRFYNEQLEMIGEVRKHTSLIFVRRWNTYGEFEIHFDKNRPELFKDGNYIMLNDDPYKTGIIKYQKDDSDGYSVNSFEDITIKGYSLLYLLSSRNTEPPQENNGYWVWNNKPIEDIMYDLVDNHAIHPKEKVRTIDFLTAKESKHRGGKLTFQSRFKNLADELNTLSVQSGLGVTVWLDVDNKNFVFEVLEGIDRSYAIDNPDTYIFSKGKRNVAKRAFTHSSMEACTMAYVGGQGDGSEREIVKIGNELSGLNRWETFVDARDIEEGQITALQDRGKTKLSEMQESVSIAFEAKVKDYKVKWDLGDITTYLDDESGFIKDDRITQVTETYEEDSFTIDPVFGYQEPGNATKVHQNSVEMTNERVGISASFKYLYAENATIKNAIIEKADIKDLNAVTATVETLRAQTAEIQVLVADKASIGDLNAATARITELEADTADIRKAIIDVAHIGDLTAITADITNLKADYSELNTAMIGKADIDLANIKNGCITTAMIGTGVIGTTQIADGSITDAKIVGLTANKITAGRLDAALIEVVNLNAANITVGTINGVQIAPGAITGDKLAQQVNDQITGAANAAQQAQTTADGKNKIYYQNTQPGLTGNKKGDTWFDTANGYKAYVWDGTKWSASPFGSGALSDAVNSSITTAGSNASTALANAAAAKTAADQAAKDAQTAQSNASAAKTAADQAAKDLEAAEKNLAAVTGRVDATEEEIAAAQAAVTTAQNKANAAAQAAASAQSTADTAKQNAATAQTKADSAYSLADQAKKAAATAQTSADGKNTVFYQTAQPPTTGRKTGDTWFDT
ncbi:siphovirus ReqiPepy6 Gp37-like family protein, partial [Eubacterium callanderi]|nr:siphovirus ReqiPepy6 Gp37-like family protein [Eubacterium callanderi]